MPEQCPSCRADALQTQGVGTEKLCQEMSDLFPGLAIDRLDRDSASTSASIEKKISDFAKGHTQLFIGTQMITKGHDFPNVTLVGVISADASLNFPDHRATERTFQLLSQVAGRAGRGERPGTVYLQAYATTHYALKTAIQHDYTAFTKYELRARQELNYPPFSHLALLEVLAKKRDEAFDTCMDIVARMQNCCLEQQLTVEILGPAPAYGVFTFYYVAQRDVIYICYFPYFDSLNTANRSAFVWMLIP